MNYRSVAKVSSEKIRSTIREREVQIQDKNDLHVGKNSAAIPRKPSQTLKKLFTYNK